MTRSARVGLLSLVSVVALATAAVGEEPKYNFEDLSPVGKPENFKRGQPSRYAVWFDDEGWHVRTTSGDKGPHAFAGMIEIIGGKMTGMTIVGIEAAKKKEADTGTWNPQKTMFKFTLKTGAGHTDGFDLKVSDKTTALKFTLTAGGDETPAKVFIGAKGAHPKAATFYLPARPEK